MSYSSYYFHIFLLLLLSVYWRGLVDVLGLVITLVLVE